MLMFNWTLTTATVPFCLAKICSRTPNQCHSPILSSQDLLSYKARKHVSSDDTWLRATRIEAQATLTVLNLGSVTVTCTPARSIWMNMLAFLPTSCHLTVVLDQCPSPRSASMCLSTKHAGVLPRLEFFSTCGSIYRCSISLPLDTSYSREYRLVRI